MSCMASDPPDLVTLGPFLRRRGCVCDRVMAVSDRHLTGPESLATDTTQRLMPKQESCLKVEAWRTRSSVEC